VPVNTFASSDVRNQFVLHSPLSIRTLVGSCFRAVIVPPMHARGVPLRAWMVWTVMALSIAICIGPDLYRRYRRRPV
jgi:hypothetical protein